MPRIQKLTNSDLVGVLSSSCKIKLAPHSAAFARPRAGFRGWCNLSTLSGFLVRGRQLVCCLRRAQAAFAFGDLNMIERHRTTVTALVVSHPVYRERFARVAGPDGSMRLLVPASWSFLPLAVALWLLLMTASTAACEAVRFTEIPIVRTSASPAQDAVRLAYPQSRFSGDGRTLTFDGQHWLDWSDVRNLAPEEILDAPTIAEQFRYIYPLEFDLRQREEAFFDPGRIRNHDFFSTLYFAEERSIRHSLVSVRDAGLGNAPFQVTLRNNVSCQLAAAFAALAEMKQNFSSFFRGAGGGFAWRKVSGTARLSPHSFGIAIDLNPKLGGYWLWSGARPGKVGRYENRIPEALVRTMESFGFIWGGKWHHYDGMHFEYRPEIILHARMMKP